jgi:membrane-associated phospholipid phosphatase
VDVTIPECPEREISTGTALNVRKPDVYDEPTAQSGNCQFGSSKRFAVNAIISVAVLFGIAGLMTVPELIDRPVVTALNGYGSLHPAINWIMFQFDNCATYSGVAMMMVIWWCWFEAGTVSRVRLLAGTLAAFPAGIVSRFLQHQLSSHPRPAYDTAQNFKLPEMIKEGIYNTWNSFPSDHAAVFAGLVITIYIVRPRIGLIAGAYLAIIESSRMFMGAHYLTDLLGGAALAAVVIWAVQAPVFLNLAERAVRYERNRPSWFYATGFLISYQVATLFGDIRNLTGGFHIIGLFR